MRNVQAPGPRWFTVGDSKFHVDPIDPAGHMAVQQLATDLKPVNDERLAKGLPPLSRARTRLLELCAELAETTRGWENVQGEDGTPQECTPLNVHALLLSDTTLAYDLARQVYAARIEWNEQKKSSATSRPGIGAAPTARSRDRGSASSAGGTRNRARRRKGGAAPTSPAAPTPPAPPADAGGS